MKNTGVNRKIDDLGRIVIPKEIRGALDIKTGDSLEFYIENGKIILEKYDQMISIKDKSLNVINSVNNLVDANIFITDQEKIITPGDLENKGLPKDIRKFITNRENYISKNREAILFSDILSPGYFIIKCIIKDSNAVGLIILYKKDKIISDDKLFMNVLKNIIENN